METENEVVKVRTMYAVITTSKFMFEVSSYPVSRSNKAQYALSHNGKEYTASLCEESVKYLEKQLRSELGYEELGFGFNQKRKLLAVGIKKKDDRFDDYDYFSIKQCPTTAGSSMGFTAFASRFYLRVEGRFLGRLENNILVFDLTKPAKKLKTINMPESETDVIAIFFDKAESEEIG